MTTPDLNTLRALKARIDAAMRADREIEGAVHLALFPDDAASLFMSGRYSDATWEFGTPQGLIYRTTHGGGGVALPAYTASTDAALALVERVLPGWVWNVYACQSDFLTDKDRPFACDLSGPVSWVVMDREVGEEPSFESSAAGAPTGPLAILSALISALIAQQEAALV